MPCHNRPPNLNRLQLAGAAAVDERVFGLGEQFTVLNMKGRKVPILSQEPGIGRRSATDLASQSRFHAGGAWHNTNAPAPWYHHGTAGGQPRELRTQHL